MPMISIEADMTECKRFVDELGYESKYIQQDMLKAIGQKCRTRAKANYRKQNFTQSSGSLYRSINYGLSKDKSKLYISANARGKDKVKYGYVLAAGYRKIMHKNNYGNWTSSGQKVRFRRLFDIIEDPVKRYLDSPKYRADLDKALKKKIEKIEKKLGIRE